MPLRLLFCLALCSLAAGQRGLKGASPPGTILSQAAFELQQQGKHEKPAYDVKMESVFVPDPCTWQRGSMGHKKGGALTLQDFACLYLPTAAQLCGYECSCYEQGEGSGLALSATAAPTSELLVSCCTHSSPAVTSSINETHKFME